MARAVRYREYGGPEVLRLEEVRVPEPGPGQVLVRVAATGVNPADWKMRKGAWSAGRPLDKPAGVGLDLAGVVDAVGPDVTRVQPGQAVFGKTSGAAATHTLARADNLLPRPQWLDVHVAAALPTVAETAVRALRLLEVQPGQTLLIHAVAGGVGLTAAQLARARGLTVIGTASAPRHDFLRERGIEPVTYGDGWAGRVRAAAPQGVDKVLDASGRGELPASIDLAGRSSVLTIVDPAAAQEHGATYTGGAVATPVPLAEVFDELLPLLRDGALVMPIAQTFPLDRIADAHRLSESGHLLGRIVITVD